MKIQMFTYAGEGMNPVYKNEKWMVGIKNFKQANAVENLDMLERHNKTDELFVLLEGNCTLIYANEADEGFIMEKVGMKKETVYNIPAGLWHNTVMTPGTKMLLIEAPDTSTDNSDFASLNETERRKVKDLCKQI